MKAVLYITRNGLLEPLGQSQILAYLKGLSRGYRITVISFEKAEDAADLARMNRIREECSALGIRWLPRRFHFRPRFIAPVWSMTVLLWSTLREIWRGNCSLVHARAYLPAAVAWAAMRLTGTPFIFDMRALWAEELIMGRRIRRGSAMHRLILGVERVCLRDASAVISLTHGAVDYLRSDYPIDLSHQRFAIIPTCTDLSKFSPKQSQATGTRIHGCIGTVLSGWFQIDWLAAWFQALSRRDPAARFEVLTRDDAAKVRQAIDPKDVLSNRLKIAACAPEDLPETLQRHDLSVMFFEGGLGKLGSFPTRMGEVLGTGLPIVSNSGIGEVGRLITEHRVGVLLEAPEEIEISKALDELDRLMADPALARRCRAAAEALFSLEDGTDKYRSVYEAILGEENVVGKEKSDIMPKGR